MRGVFVTGTDTGVGKTWATLGLMELLKAEGLRVAGMKPVASGCRRTAHGLRNEDAERIRAHASAVYPYRLVNPVALEPPIAPHIAAHEAGVRISPARIEEAFRALCREADCCVVEGVGGWLVPLSPARSVADLALRLRLPVVLVVGLRLGCINHALLSARSIIESGAELCGWIGNVLDPEMARRAENVETLERHIAAPLLGVVPHCRPAPSAAQFRAALSGGPFASRLLRGTRRRAQRR